MTKLDEAVVEQANKKFIELKDKLSKVDTQEEEFTTIQKLMTLHKEISQLINNICGHYELKEELQKLLKKIEKVS